MPFNFDEPVNRRGTDSGKWAYYGDDVLPLWVADMDFISPPPVLEALHRRVDHGVFGYGSGSAELAEVVRERLHRLYGWDVAAEELLAMPGVIPGFNAVCRAVGEQGDGVLVQTPVYTPFLRAPANSGRTLEIAELQQGEDRYEIDFERFEAAITPRTKLFILCNPHNPVGRVYERWELERLAEICLRHDLWICSDEIHCDLLLDGRRHIPIASLSPEVARRCVTLLSPSKTFNIAGLHCAIAVVQNREMLRQMKVVLAGILSSPDLLGIVAAVAAYREGQPWLDALLPYLVGNRDALVEYLRQHLPSIKMTPLEGTYLAWLDCRESGIVGNPSQFFLQEAKVAMNDGATFGRGGEGFVRLNLGCTRATLMQALSRMQEALARLT